MGKCSGDLRLPLTPMAEGNLKKLTQAMTRVRPSLKISWRSELSSAVSAAGWAAPSSGRFNKSPDFNLVAAIDKPGSARLGKDAGEMSAAGHLGIPITDNPEAALKTNTVIIDFTNPEASLGFLRSAAKKLHADRHRHDWVQCQTASGNQTAWPGARRRCSRRTPAWESTFLFRFGSGGEDARRRLRR